MVQGSSPNFLQRVDKNSRMIRVPHPDAPYFPRLKVPYTFAVCHITFESVDFTVEAQAQKVYHMWE